MSWSRPQEAVVLVGAAAVVAAAGLLLAVRRPAPPIRIIDTPGAAAVVVQVDGAVPRPGLYRLAAGARVGDALRAAGGLTPDADDGALNQARPLRDGDRVTAPIRRPPSPERRAEPERRPAGRAAPSGAASGSARPVDLNAATAAELEALPGIGPVLARRIVEHRAANGPFQRVESLLRVHGIGPRLLERLGPLVVVR